MFLTRRVVVFTCVLTFGGFLGGNGCNKSQRTVPPPPPSLPPLPEGSAKPVGQAGALPIHGLPVQSPHGPHGPHEEQGPQQTDSPHAASAPHVHDSPSAWEGEGAKQEGPVLVSGVLKVVDSVKAQAKDGATVFLSARGMLDNGKPGPVFAAKKLRLTGQEMLFSLSERDLMGMGGIPKGQVLLLGRVDQDEDASTRQPGDVEGQSGPFLLPGKDRVLLLDTVRKEGQQPGSGMGAPHGMGGMGGTH